MLFEIFGLVGLRRSQGTHTHQAMGVVTYYWRDNQMGLTGHMGSDLGVFTALYFDPESKNGLIILMNRGVDGKAGSVMKKIATRLMEE